MLNDNEKAFLDATISKYREMSMGSGCFSFMDAAYAVAKATDEEGLKESMPDYSQNNTESRILRFRNGDLVNRPLSPYVIDVNAIMARYMGGLLQRADAQAYIEAKLIVW